MTREEKERFIRNRWFDLPIEDAIKEIVDCWEDDVEENRKEAVYLKRISNG